MSRPYQDAPASILSGGNQWDTSAFLRAAAEHTRANATSPLRDAFDAEDVHDDDLRAFALKIAHETILRSGVIPHPRGLPPTAEQYERAADWLDTQLALDAEADTRAEISVRPHELAG